MYEIIFYEDKNGYSDVAEYIRELEQKRHLEKNWKLQGNEQKNIKGGIFNMITWDELRASFNLTEEEEQAIEFEKELINTMIKVREEKNLTQKQLAELCGIKQPAIARMEKMLHSPQIDSILRILVPLGYTLKIVPLKKS